MKRSLAIFFTASLSLVALNAGSTVPEENRPASAPGTSPATAPTPSAATAPLTWLLAQDRRMPTCKLDEREVPTGTTICRKKRFVACERGEWVDTGKPC